MLRRGKKLGFQCDFPCNLFYRFTLLLSDVRIRGAVERGCFGVGFTQCIEGVVLLQQRDRVEYVRWGGVLARAVEVAYYLGRRKVRAGVFQRCSWWRVERPSGGGDRCGGLLIARRVFAETARLTVSNAIKRAS